MMLEAQSGFTVHISHLGKPTAIREEWMWLEQCARPPLFLRWYWIGCWLEAFSPTARLIRVAHCGETVALGLFCIKPRTRHRIIRSQRLYLHQTGIPHQDQIWIEYNGLLAKEEHRAICLRLATEALLKEKHGHEVHLSMLPGSLATPLRQTLPWARESQRTVGYLRHLGHAREQGDDILAALSPNTRYQIRRSIRGYTARYGEPRIEATRDVDDALAAFHEAGIWHRQRWPDSGFDNPAFTAFHETLINRGFDHNNAMLYRVIAGDHPVGVFFYLRSDQCVHFYLQGVAPESDGKLKPGLMSHALLMQHFMEQGYSHYDFMGGDSQYKQQLADETIEFMTIDVHNGALRFRLEDCARRARNVWRARLGRKDA